MKQRCNTVKPHAAPFKCNNVESKQGHECRVQLCFKEKKKPPKFERKKQEKELVPKEDTLAKFTQQRNEESTRSVQQQLAEKQLRQNKQKEKVDPEQQRKKEQRELQKKLEKVALRMGLSSAYKSGDRQAQKAVRMKHIEETGGGLTTGNGIAFKDGSAVFVSKGTTGKQFQQIVKKHHQTMRQLRKQNKI